MKDYFEDIFAIKAVAVFFGFVGGLLSLTVGGARTPLIAVASVLSGLVCATAFTPVVHEIWAYSDNVQSAVAFCLGLGGHNLVKFISENLNAQTFSRIFSRWLNKGIAPVDETTSKK